MRELLTEFAIAAVVPTAQMLAFLILGLPLRVDHAGRDKR